MYYCNVYVSIKQNVAFTFFLSDNSVIFSQQIFNVSNVFCNIFD